ncbi:MAG: N-acetylneuraminate synthase [Alphaproteobacteria bacterium]|nr:N-acetylneuraminate synthase [Alphaproteobacteria bacterium]|tara:strand:+ start:28228 stop:29298 length:1071 start_codon:yes stop_codon:yes gene_type:complete
MSGAIHIGKGIVGDGHPTYFIADIAANHDGDLERAKTLIHLCAESGANAAKFQNFKAETIVSDFGFKSLGGQQSHQASWGKSVFDVYADASLPMTWTGTLKEECDKAGIDYFTAPYDLELIAELSEFVCAWKLGSGDITWHENIVALASSGKPLIMATGAASMDEVKLAVEVARRHTDEIVLLQCNTNYTASLENFRHIALNVLRSYAREFPGTILGLSDHTPGHATVLGAIALGGKVIEKHFTDDTTRSGPDHKFSMDPRTWREMVNRSRELELALGSEDKRVMENEEETLVLQRRAVRAVRSIPAGATLSEADLTYLRPCPVDALPPYRRDELLGKRVVREIENGDCIRPADVQ